MGTEIILHRNNQYYVSQYQVKLNNPLMGTEILIIMPPILKNYANS